MAKTRVLICDDSAIVRDILSKELARHPDMEVAATATDPFIAREKLSQTKIDILLLDIEMPRMDGLTFLKYLMKYYPIPVIILSSLVDGNNKASLEAMELGAIDIVPKPGGPFSIVDILSTLVESIRASRNINFNKIREQAATNTRIIVPSKHKILSTIQTTRQLIAIGASTGGTNALEILFRSWQQSMPPTLVVIHMPEKFTASFAKRLNELCHAEVKEAEDGEYALPGTIYIAPGNFHMSLRLSGSSYCLRIQTAPKIHGQRPAVDPLFDSVATQVGRNAIGVLLTGMGKDGATGLLHMKQQGAFTLCQNEESCIVFGMPKAAIDLGAASEICALNDIHLRITQRIAQPIV